MLVRDESSIDQKLLNRSPLLAVITAHEVAIDVIRDVAR